LPEIVIQYDHDWWTTLEKEKEFQEMWLSRSEWNLSEIGRVYLFVHEEIPMPMEWRIAFRRR
jgi:hypothetical protein